MLFKPSSLWYFVMVALENQLKWFIVWFLMQILKCDHYGISKVTYETA